MYTKCIQNVYHIFANLCIDFVCKIKRTMPAKFYIQNLYKSLSKCGIHFVYILYLKVCQNMGYILYANISYSFCIQKFVKIWDTFCVKTFCIHFVYILYTKYIQKFVKRWDTFCIQKFCIHLACINSDLLEAYIINIMYTICIQSSYKMYMQIIRMDSLFRHILTHLLCTSQLIIANN